MSSGRIHSSTLIGGYILSRIVGAMTARLRSISNSNLRFHSHDFIINVFFCSNQTLLNAFDNFFSCDLILEILLEDKLSMALTIQFEVGGTLNILLIYNAKLVRHLIRLINVQYVLGLSIGVGSLILGHAHKWSWLLLT